MSGPVDAAERDDGLTDWRAAVIDHSAGDQPGALGRRRVGGDAAAGTGLAGITTCAAMLAATSIDAAKATVAKRLIVVIGVLRGVLLAGACPSGPRHKPRGLPCLLFSVPQFFSVPSYFSHAAITASQLSPKQTRESERGNEVSSRKTASRAAYRAMSATRDRGAVGMRRFSSPAAPSARAGVCSDATMSVVQEQLSTSLAGRYRIERELGAGGMATVYLARDLRHDRQVALKVMNADVVAAVGGERFVQEIRTTANLKHPHILPLFDSGAAADTLFYVMPYIDGESLRARIRRSGPLPVGEALQILREVADGLAHAHAQGVIHRDIKPDNVLLSGSHAFLADFGIARAFEGAEAVDRTMTATVAVVGTPAYMSPEQIRGQRQLDHRTDIYTFGVMAYEMLAGVPPFEATTAAAVMSAHLTEAPEPLSRRRRDVPPALAALVMKCLEKRAEDRWQQTGDLLAALTTMRAGPAFGAGGRVATRLAPSSSDRSWPWR